MSTLNRQRTYITGVVNEIISRIERSETTQDEKRIAIAALAQSWNTIRERMGPLREMIQSQSLRGDVLDGTFETEASEVISFIIATTDSLLNSDDNTYHPHLPTDNNNDGIVTGALTSPAISRDSSLVQHQDAEDDEEDAENHPQDDHSTTSIN